MFIIDFKQQRFAPCPVVNWLSLRIDGAEVADRDTLKKSKQKLNCNLSFKKLSPRDSPYTPVSVTTNISIATPLWQNYRLSHITCHEVIYTFSIHIHIVSLTWVYGLYSGNRTDIGFPSEQSLFLASRRNSPTFLAVGKWHARASFWPHKTAAYICWHRTNVKTRARCETESHTGRSEQCYANPPNSVLF